MWVRSLPPRYNGKVPKIRGSFHSFPDFNNCRTFSCGLGRFLHDITGKCQKLGVPSTPFPILFTIALSWDTLTAITSPIETALINPCCRADLQHASFEFPFLLEVMLALCLLKNEAMRSYGKVQVWLHAFVAQTVDGAEWSGSRLWGALCAKRIGDGVWGGVGPPRVIQKFRNNWKCLGKGRSVIFAWNLTQISWSFLSASLVKQGS